MIIIDISRNLMFCPTYPGTLPAELVSLAEISGSSDYKLSQLNAELHVGTHVDAPLHYFTNGLDVASLNLTRFVGPCRVTDVWENLPKVAPSILLLKNQTKRPINLADCERFYAVGIRTIGTDALSLSTQEDETAVHRYLLEREMGIIENLDLSTAPDGEYLLVAAPIKIAGAEASFCRAILIEGYS